MHWFDHPHATDREFELHSPLKYALHKFFVAIVLLVFSVIAFGLFMNAYVGESIRLDEAQSLWQVSHSVNGMLGIISEDVHMPLYHLVLHTWVTFFGNSVMAARMLSFVFLIATFPFAYLLARTVMGRKWALATVGLLAISPFLSWYASETRMYTMLVFFSVANQYFFTRILKHQHHGWFGYAITTILGAFTHYFFFFNLATQVVFFLLNRDKFKKASFIKFVGVAVITAISLAPWVALFIHNGAAGNMRPGLSKPSPVDFFNAYSNFLFGYQSDILNTVILAAWPLVIAGAFLALRRRLKINSVVMYLLFAAFVPVILVFVLSYVITPFFLSRYLIASLIPLYILIVWLVSHQPKKTAYGALAAGVLLSSMFLYRQAVMTNNPAREDYKNVAMDIAKDASPRDVIVMTSPFTAFPFEYYYNGTTKIVTLPLWDRGNHGAIPAFSATELPKQVDQIKKDHDNIYLVMSYDQGYEDAIRQYFLTHYEQIQKRQYSPKLQMIEYKVNYDNPVSYTK